MGRIERKPIGYWFSQEEPHLPNPKDFVNPYWDITERNAVVAYLRAGNKGPAFKGSAPCRLCPERLGSCDMYDDVYMWPQKTEHYLLKHGVKPPQEFIDHALKKDTQ